MTVNLALKICKILEPVFLTYVYLFSKVFKFLFGKKKNLNPFLLTNSCKIKWYSQKRFENTKMELIHVLNKDSGIL
jgi:hypothetical protein